MYSDLAVPLVSKPAPSEWLSSGTPPLPYVNLKLPGLKKFMQEHGKARAYLEQALAKAFSTMPYQIDFLESVAEPGWHGTGQGWQAVYLVGMGEDIGDVRLNVYWEMANPEGLVSFQGAHAGRPKAFRLMCAYFVPIEARKTEELAIL